MTDILLTTTELIDGVEVTGTAATIATTEGAAGDPIGTAAAAVAAHVADTTDAHALAGITGLTAALAGKADDADVTALDGRLDVLEAVNPVLTINGDPPDVDGNVDIVAGGGTVDSVNGQTGVVVLDSADVGADASGDAAAAQAAAEATAAGALSAHAADTTSVHGIADTSALALTGDAPTAHAASHQDGGTDELALDGSQITTGTVADARIASTIARDSEVASTYAPLASPALTGTPTAPTAAQGTNTTQVASTAYVQTEAGLLIPKSLVDAKGDLLVGSADNTVIRKAVGSDGEVLTADAASTGGVKWATPASGGGVTVTGVRGTGTGTAYNTTSTSYVDLTGFSTTIAATAGQKLLCRHVAGVYADGSGGLLWVGLNIGGTFRGGSVRHIQTANQVFQIVAEVLYTVQSGDISGGNVTVKTQWKVNSSTGRMVNDTGDIVPQLTVLNCG